MNTNSTLVQLALSATTVREAEDLEKRLFDAIGARYQRPLFDTVDNWGAVTGGSGSYDSKTVELVTNMQDTVLERAAFQKFGVDVPPYRTPLEAANDLFQELDYRSLSAKAVVEIRESDPPIRTSKKITFVSRDQGCGITPEDIPHTIFALRSTKKGCAWQQGAFGIGGKTTFRNAAAVVLVSRRAPELLKASQEDRIAIAVLNWKFEGKTQTAYYPVTKPWATLGDDSAVFSVAASDYPEFEAGTHLALISYPVEQIWQLNFGDERSFYALLNTRLFKPVMPIAIDRPGQGRQNARGLKKRLDDNPGEPKRPTNCETLPFAARGTTYHLPITYWMFSAPNEEGARRKFAAPGYVVLFTSNGQAHHQWASAEFRDKIPSLQRLADRLLVTVETDELPIELRSTLFTADRSAMMRTEEALRLEREVAAFLREWDDLKEFHAELVRKALSDGSTQQSTVNLAKELGRLFQGIGFGVGASKKTFGRSGSANGSGPGYGSQSKAKAVTIDLLEDPTFIDGPTQVTAVAGESKFLHFELNAVDGFIPDRSVLDIKADDERIGAREITVGRLSRGRVRVSIAIPEEMTGKEFSVSAEVAPWLRTSGGMSNALKTRTAVQVVDSVRELRPAKPSAVSRNGTASGGGSDEGPGAGDMVPVIWRKDPMWTPKTVGQTERLRAVDVAQAQQQYQQLAVLGDQLVWVLELNEEYAPFKKYNAASVKGVTDRTRQNRRNRYAIGVGTGLLALGVEVEKKRSAGRHIDDELIMLAQQAVATAVLADLRAYDELAEETGVDEQQNTELISF